MKQLTTSAADAGAIPGSLSAIADIIRQDWKNIYYGAVPYLEAMQELTHIRQNYFDDSAETVVRYFLANAWTWRGEVARKVKARLNQLLKAA